MKKRVPGCLGDYRGLYYPISYGDFYKPIYKDPCKPNSIMESRRIFFVAHMD